MCSSSVSGSCRTINLGIGPQEEADKNKINETITIFIRNPHDSNESPIYMKIYFRTKMPLLTHPHPDPPLEGEGNSLSLRERVRVRVGIFMPLCEPWIMTAHSFIIRNAQ